MKATLHLTAHEAKALRAVVPQWTWGQYKFAEETLTFSDTEQGALDRLAMMELNTPSLRKAARELHGAESAERAAAALDALKIDKISRHDFTEVLFAIGPEKVGRLLCECIDAAKTDEDVADIAALSYERHCLLQAMQPDPV